MDRPLSWQLVFLGSFFTHSMPLWQHCVTNLGQAGSPQILSPEVTNHKARWDWWLCCRGWGFWDIYVHKDACLKPAEESWKDKGEGNCGCVCVILLAEVSEPAGQAQGGQAASAPARPTLILAAAPLLSSLPAGCSRPFSRSLCSQLWSVLPQLLLVPEPLPSCPARVPSAIGVPAPPGSRGFAPLPPWPRWAPLPLIFYHFFPCASSPQVQAWASRPRCSGTLGSILPSHLRGAEVPVLGWGIAPQSSPCCAAEPMPSISPSLSALLLQHLIPSSESPGQRRLLGSARA